MADKEILVNVKVQDKQLKQAIEYAKQLANLLSGEGANSSELNTELDKALKTIERLKSAEKDRSEKTLKFGIKKFEQSKLELQKQKELAKQAKQAATVKNREDKKRIAAAAKIAKKLDEEQRLISKEATSYDELAKQTAILTKQRKQLNLTTSEGQTEFARLSDILEQNNSQLKAFDGQIGNFQRNVGDYKNQIGELIPGIGGINSALLKLAANPVVATIAALVITVKVLFDAFKKTEDGQKGMAAATGLLNAGLSMLTRLAGLAAKAVEKFAVDPVQGIKDLGTALKDNIIGRFQAIGKAVGSFAKIFSSLWDGDFAAAGEAAKEYGKNLTQVITGADLDKIADWTNELTLQAKAFAALELAKRKQMKINRGLEISNSKLSTSVELLTQKADDSTISLNEQQKAANELEKAQRKLAENELARVSGSLKLIDREIKLKKANGEQDQALYDARKDALIAVEEAERNLTLAIGQNEIRKRQIISDNAELTLDALIDETDARIRNNEKRINSDKTAASERTRLVQENKTLQEKALSDQVEVLNRFATEQIDINELLNTSDAKQLDTKVKATGLSEILSTRLLEVIRERRDVQQDLADIEQDANDKNYEQALATFERQQELDALEFETKKAGIEETAAFELMQETELYQAKLDLKEQFNVEFADKEKELLEKQIEVNQGAAKLAAETSKKKVKLTAKEADAIQNATAAIVNAFGEQSKAGRLAAIALKGQAIARTTIAIVESIAQSAAIGFPQNIITIAGAIAQSAGLVASIKSVKLARGGILNGPSHAAGGIDIGDNQEAEGGEYVINKKSTELFKPQLDAINSYNNWGDPTVGKRKFARGGVTAAQDAAIAQQQEVLTEKIYVPVQNVTDMLDVVAEYTQVIDIQQGI